MFSKEDLMCSLKGSLIQINFPGRCFREFGPPAPARAPCLFHLSIEGEQILDGDYRQDCTKTTPTQGLPHGSNLSTSNIIIICLGVVIAISVGLIIKFWRGSIARRREFLIINSGLDNVQLDKY